MDEYTKHCRVCKQDLPCSEFPLKQNNKHDSLCRECKKNCQRAYYENNRHYYKSRATHRREWLREYIRSIKATTPCTDCGRKYHYCVMDFDHREDEAKLFNLSGATWRKGRKQIEKEIAKCDVVCSNCHRIRTHLRSGFDLDPKIAASKTRRGLTREDVNQIFILYATGTLTHKQIAARFGVHRTAITHLLAGKSHKWGR